VTGDHHSAYLARAVGALTPAGRDRVDELLEQLAEAAGGREQLVRFAAARKSEADLGRTDPEPDPGRPLTEQELDALLGGFMRIRDQAPGRRRRLGERRDRAPRGRAARGARARRLGPPAPARST
jgi:hypothetical protein